MTKKDIARNIAEELGLTASAVKEVIQRVFDGIIEVLADEGRIELRNFGVFEVKKRKARQARNPRTGEKVLVPERMGIRFKPGMEMTERVETLLIAHRLYRFRSGQLDTESKARIWQASAEAP